MVRLAPVLHAGDLPLAELCAARLDGELVALGDAFLPVDGTSGPVERAMAAGRFWPPRLIAERLTAAWIWGAAPDPPARHQLCASVDARARPAVPARSVVREVVIAADEYRLAGVIRVTSPLRTATDLARATDGFTEHDTRVVAALLADFAIDLDQCRDALDRRRNLPGKKQAWMRLQSIAGARDEVGGATGVSPS